MMFACSKLALAEFKVGFSRRATGAPGARDFVSLTAFFGLMTFLIFLAWSARDGLWGRIEQVLLGAMTEGQAPIRLSYHIDNVNKININVLAEFAEKFPGLKIAPQRNSDGGSGALVLPGLSAVLDANGKASEQDGSWERGLSDKRVTQLRIDALALDSPLWSWILSKPQARGVGNLDPAQPVLVVAASRYLFGEHFRYDVYRNAIMADRMVPCELKAQLPERIGRIDELRHLVLEVKENITAAPGKRSSVPSYQSFRVIWMDSFPTPEQTAIIVPLSTYEIMMASAERQSVHLFAEGLGAASPADRIVQIRLAEVDVESDGIAEFGRLASCLGAVPVEGSESEAEKAGDNCRTTDGIGRAANRRSDTGEAIGTCERLRERLPVKYPRFIDNGQDLLICAGVHRLLRTSEVSACAKSAGLKDINGDAKQFDGRLDASAVVPPKALEWLGPSRIAMPCGALLASDLEFAKALRDDRVRSAVRRARETAPASDARPVDDDDGWIATCEAYKKTHLVDGFDGPRAVYVAQGYQDITVYPRPMGGKLVGLKPLANELGAFIHRGFHDTAPVMVAASRVLFGDDQTERALNSLAKILLGWETTLGRPDGATPTPVLRLDPTYESALVRFGVLSLILDKISTPLAAGSLALYLFLTAVILATATAHRRRQYGLLLMSGISPGDVGYIVAVQIVLSCILGGIAGCAVYLATAAAINALLADSSIVAGARLIIGLDVPAFLPSLSSLTVAALWCGMTLLAVVVGTVILRVQRITTAAAPISLVKS